MLPKISAAFVALTEKLKTEESEKWTAGKVVDRRQLRLDYDKQVLAQIHSKKLQELGKSTPVPARESGYQTEE